MGVITGWSGWCGSFVFVGQVVPVATAVFCCVQEEVARASELSAVLLVDTGGVVTGVIPANVQGDRVVFQQQGAPGTEWVGVPVVLQQLKLPAGTAIFRDIHRGAFVTAPAAAAGGVQGLGIVLRHHQVAARKLAGLNKTGVVLVDVHYTGTDFCTSAGWFGVGRCDISTL